MPIPLLTDTGLDAGSMGFKKGVARAWVLRFRILRLFAGFFGCPGHANQGTS